MNKRHIFSMYTNIVTIKKTMCLFIHIISMYTHILKFVTIKRNYVNKKDTHFHNTPF